MKKRIGTAFALLGAVALSAGPAMAQDTSNDLRFAALNDPGIDRVQQLLVDHYTTVTHPGAKVTKEILPADIATLYSTQAAAGSLADVLFTADLFVVPFSQQ